MSDARGMRIAFVNNQYQYGGAETVVRQLLRGSRAAGHHCELHVDIVNSGDPAAVVDDAGVRRLYPITLERLRRVPGARATIDRRAPRRSWTDRRFAALAGADVDLVHLHSFHGVYASIESLGLVARRHPFVWTMHGAWAFTGGCDNPNGCLRYRDACGSCPQVGVWNVGPVDRTAEELERKLRWLADAPIQIVAPSKHFAGAVRASRVGQKWDVAHIPNGVDTTRFAARKNDRALRASLGLDPDATTILVVNREFRDGQKGFDMIPDAVAALDGRGVQVVLVGHDAAWAAKRLPVHVPFVALGYVSDADRLAALYASTDILLYSSKGENFPCTILEAMAAECCIVTVPDAGVGEQLDRNIAVIAADRTAAALGVALREIVDDASRRRHLGSAARRHVVREFSEQGMVDRYLELYRAVLARRGHRSSTQRHVGSA